VIVWACGYKTNICSVYESDGVTPIPLGYYRDQVEVDDLARILTSKPQEAAFVPPPPSSIISCVYSSKSIIRSIERRSSNADMAVNTDTRRSYEEKGKGGSQDGNTDEEFETYSDRGSRDAYTARATILKSTSQDSSVFDISQPPAVAVPVALQCSADVIATGLFDTDGLNVSRTPERKGSIAMKHPLSPNIAHTTARVIAAPSPAFIPVGGLLGSGMGFGLKAVLDNGEADGSSGRADGVAVYLKHGATLVLAHVLGPSVYGEGISSWEDRTAAMRKTAIQSHPHSRSEPSKMDIVIGSDAEGLDNAYRQRMVTTSFGVSSSRSQVCSRTNDPPSPLSLHSPRCDRDRRRSASCCRRDSSPSPSIETVSSATRSDLDLVSLSRQSPSRAFPSSNSAPSTARRSLSQLDPRHAHLSRAAANASAVARSVSPSPSLFPHRIAALADQQALGVTRLSAPRPILVATPRTPSPVTVFLDNETIQASVSRLNACPARCVAVQVPPQPHSEVTRKRSSYSKGVTASSDSSTVIRKSTSSGNEKKIQKLPAKVSSVSPKIAEKPSSETPTTPSRSLPHRRAIQQSEVLSKASITVTPDLSSSSVFDALVEGKSSSQLCSKSGNDKVRVSRRSISVPPTSRAARKIVQVPMALKPVMIELDLTGRGRGIDPSNILRVGLPFTHLTAAAGAVTVSEENKIPWSGAGVVAEKQKQKHRMSDHTDTKDLRGPLLSASVPGNFVDLIGVTTGCFILTQDHPVQLKATHHR
jgi:hypothetical protein